MNIFSIEPDGSLTPPFFRGAGPDFPPHELCSYSDQQCMAILNTLGAGWLLQHRAAEDRRTKPGEAYQRAYFVYDHPTHWLCFVRWEQAACPEDNGYAMHGWPKTSMTREQFRVAAKEQFQTIAWERGVETNTSDGHHRN